MPTYEEVLNKTRKYQILGKLSFNFLGYFDEKIVQNKTKM